MSVEAQNSVIVVPHTHWDREWYLPFESFRMRLVDLLDKLCDILEADPLDSFHMDGQTIVLEDYEEIRGRSERLRKFVKEGRIQVGPWYVLPDEFLPSGEAIIRNFQYGINISHRWGEPCRVGYLPDMFGHIGQMPQILRGLGINRAIAWRGVPPDVGQCGFRWQSPDSSEVFTAFLPMGYSNGFNLPLDVGELRGRVVLTRAIMQRFIEGPTWLLMAGTDHQAPRPGFPQALKKILEGLDGWDARIGKLEEYFDRLEPESKTLTEVTGELRDTHYAPILPAIASTRMYLKKQDFINTSLIERYAEPLAAWAWAAGGADHRDFLNYAWKLLLQNHPHDSICGCSVDEVHREMEVRYGRIEQIAKRVRDETAGELGRMINLPAGKWFGIWRPAGDEAPAPMAIEIDGWTAGRPPKVAMLVDPDGKNTPMQVLEQVEPGEVLAKVDVPTIASSMALAFLFQEEEMLGGYMVRADISSKKNGAIKLTVGLGRSPAGIDFDKTKKRIEKAIASSGAGMLNIEVKKQPRVKVAATIDGVTPFSIGAFKIAAAKKKDLRELKVENGSIENSRWLVIAEDDGSLTIRDKEAGAEYENALRYVDEGDRGDEYNFEPVAGDKFVDKPEKVKVRKLYEGPVAVGMRIDATYRIPVGLDRTGKSRSKRTTPLKISTDVVLYEAARWIDFRSNIDNTARDHRLRVLFEAPFATEEFICESALEVVTRKACIVPEPRKPDPSDIMAALIGPETTVGFAPHRGFTAIEDGKVGMALFNRGLPEIEAVEGKNGTALALTLVRSVGTISRDDLTLRLGHAGPPIATPEAQCLGEQVCEFAFASYAGTWQETNLPAIAHSWRHQPHMFAISGGKGPLSPGDGPITSDNPAVEIRALQPAPDGSNALCARVYNTTDKPQKARVKIHKVFTTYDEADLLGSKVEDKHIKRDGAHATTIELPPARIITLRLEFAGS